MSDNIKRVASLKDNWLISRGGFTNFWYYDLEEFIFEGGNLLLRGANGSGKSVTMQSFIPLLLDGNKRPERLDPFGSKDRKIDYFLLGESDSGIDDNTGYIFLEFKKRFSIQYKTLGMGIRARRGKPTDAWYFIIRDGRRIDHDIKLYKETDVKTVLSQREVESVLGKDNVYDNQGDYMKSVNRELFGYEKIEDYDEVIKLLVQIRSPKLSKDFSPKDLYEIINNSLPALSDEDLRPVTEAVENMDILELEIKKLHDAITSAQRFGKYYNAYNQYLLYDKAKNLLVAHQEVEASKRIIEKIIVGINDLKQSIEDDNRVVGELDSELKAANEVYLSLQDNEAVKLEERKILLESQLKNKKDEISKKEESIASKEEQLRRALVSIKSTEDKIDKAKKEIAEALEELNELAEESGFDDHKFAEDDLKYSEDINGIETVRKDARVYTDLLKNGKKALEELNTLLSSYNAVSKECDTLRDEKNELERTEKKLEDYFEELKEEYLGLFYNWCDTNKELLFTQEEKVLVAHSIREYDNDTRFDTAKKVIDGGYYRHKDTIGEIKVTTTSERNGLIKDRDAKNNELGILINSVDPEPERSEAVKKNRVRLTEANIPFIPFYRAVDFIKDISDNEKNLIESSLIDMGLLDALIIPPKFLDLAMTMDKDMADKYIVSSPNFMSYELSKKLLPVAEVTSGISSADIDNALKSIMLDRISNCYLTEDGEYSLGVIRGKSSQNYESKFIGTTSRKRYKEQLISNLKNEIATLQLRIEEKNALIKELLDREKVLMNEYVKTPSSVNLDTLLNDLQLIANSIKILDGNIVVKEASLKEVFKRYKDKEIEVTKLLNRVTLKKDVGVLADAIDSMEGYVEVLANFKGYKNSLKQHKEMLHQYTENQEDILFDMDQFNYDITRYKGEEKKLEGEIHLIKQLLESDEHKEQKKIFEDCLKKRVELPDKINELTNRASKNQGKLDVEIDKHLLEEEKLKISSQKESLYKDIFVKEFNLYNVFQYEIGNPVVAAKNAMEALKQYDKSKGAVQDYQDKVTLNFRELQSDLLEYNLKADTIFVEDVSEDTPEDIVRIIQSQRRIEVSAKINGVKYDFKKLVNMLTESMELKQNILNEENRTTFKEVLAKNIGTIIRAKIAKSAAWVRNINTLIQSMDTSISSGLSLSLDWSENAADTEKQLSTKKLVSIFNKEAGLLTDEELNLIAEHFRSKLDQIKIAMKEASEFKSYAERVKEVLDYRAWFEFKLHFKKTGEKRRELTKSALNKLSGGERAISTYVPLFAAIYARYEGARPDAPRIVTLDEAFAGVDEKNIDLAFRILEELNLNYILNSQTLWGDYPSVGTLAICELFRDQNADIIGINRYKWNGVKLEMVGIEDYIA